MTRDVAAVLVIGALALARWLFAFGSDVPERETRTAPRARTCDASALARIDGLDVGATVEDWQIDSVACVTDDECTHVVLSRASAALTVRVCPHRDGGPHAPATHDGSDLFYDVPSHELSNAQIRAILAAVVARLEEAE